MKNVLKELFEACQLKQAKRGIRIAVNEQINIGMRSGSVVTRRSVEINGSRTESLYFVPVFLKDLNDAI